MVQEGAHTYEFGDQGSILVIADDEDMTDHVHYSYDGGRTWYGQIIQHVRITLTLQEQIGPRPYRPIFTAYDHSGFYLAKVSYIQLVLGRADDRFLLLGTASRKDSGTEGRHAMIFLDFAPLQTRQCTDDDFERWNARSSEGHECLMGRKVSCLPLLVHLNGADVQQWYRRRKLDAVCYVGHKFEDPEEHEESCDCVAEDYEWYVSTPRVADILVISTLFDKMVNVSQLVLNLYRLVRVRRTMTSTSALLGIGKSQETDVYRV